MDSCQLFIEINILFKCVCEGHSRVIFSVLFTTNFLLNISVSVYSPMYFIEVTAV